MTDEERIARRWAMQELANRGYTVAEIANVFDVSPKTVRRALGQKMSLASGSET